MTLQIPTARVFVPLLDKGRFKGAKGGRGSGKSHFFAERLVERMATEPDLRWVCIREVQKSLRFSSKSLIEAKLRAHGVAHLFDVQTNLIKHKYGTGVVTFNGMQDHTADSIKSLEGFDGAWIEEGQSLSARSWELLEPTIRTENSEIWATWNPDQPTDPIDKFFNENKDDDDVILVHADLHDNPFASSTLWQSYRRDRDRALKHQEAGDKGAWARFLHVWHGAHDLNSEAIILAGHYTVEAFEPDHRWHPNFGVDWGFAADPTTMIETYLVDRTLYIFNEAYGEHIETVDLPKLFSKIERAPKNKIYADNARPEQISHCKRNGYPQMTSCKKWAGSIEDGISWLRGLDAIVIHPRCKHTIAEAGKWQFKVDKYTGDVLSAIVDANNHCWDAIRYGNQSSIVGKSKSVFDVVG